MAQEPNPLVDCLEAARAALLVQITEQGVCDNPSAVAEKAAQVNAINRLLDEIR